MKDLKPKTKKELLEIMVVGVQDEISTLEIMEKYLQQQEILSSGNHAIQMALGGAQAKLKESKKRFEFYKNYLKEFD